MHTNKLITYFAIITLLINITNATCWGSCATGSCSGLGTCNNPYGFANAIAWGMAHPNTVSHFDPPKFPTYKPNPHAWKMDWDGKYAL